MKCIVFLVFTSEDGVVVPPLISRNDLVREQGQDWVREVKAASMVTMRQYDAAVEEAGGTDEYDGLSAAQYLHLSFVPSHFTFSLFWQDPS